MSTLNKKVITNTVISIVSLPVSFFLIYYLWELNLFDFGSGALNMNFIDVFTRFSFSLFDPIMISALFFYFYYYCYSKIKKYGNSYIKTLIKKLRIELCIAYGILLIIALVNKLITPFASLFIPFILVYLIPITVFVLLMTCNTDMDEQSK